MQQTATFFSKVGTLFSLLNLLHFLKFYLVAAGVPLLSLMFQFSADNYDSFVYSLINFYELHIVIHNFF